jgi:aspartate oxidase
MKHLAIVGGGFAGLWAALAAAREFSLAAETSRWRRSLPQWISNCWSVRSPTSTR